MMGIGAMKERHHHHGMTENLVSIISKVSDALKRLIESHIPLSTFFNIPFLLLSLKMGQIFSSLPSFSSPFSSSIPAPIPPVSPPVTPLPETPSVDLSLFFEWEQIDDPLLPEMTLLSKPQMSNYPVELIPLLEIDTQLTRAFIKNYRKYPDDRDNNAGMFKRDIQSLVSIVSGESESFIEKLDKIKNYLAYPMPKILPFPSQQRPLRFEFCQKEELFRCFTLIGTQRFLEFIDYYPNYPKRELYGNIGSGKSHLLATYVIYLHCNNYLLESTKEKGREKDMILPVYISDCKLFDSTSAILWELTRAFCLSFIFSKSSEFINELWKRPSPDKSIFSPLDNLYLRSHNFIFIYDNWNAFMDPSDKFNPTIQSELKNSLTGFGGWPNQKLLIAISARSSKAYEPSYSYKRYELFGGLLSENEWRAFLEMHKVLIVDMMDFSYDSEVAAERILKRKEILEEIEFLSGRIPLFVRELLGKPGSSWNQRQEDFLQQDSVGGGHWVYRHLRSFTQQIPPNEQNDHVQVIIKALGGIEDVQANQNHYDHQFFYNQGKTVVPINGIVSRFMIQILSVLNRRMFAQSVNSAWVDTTLRSDANKSVKGFAFEAYVIAQLILNPGSYFPELKTLETEEQKESFQIIYFDSDFPQELALRNHQELGSCTFYIPRKFNLRYVDLVIRYVTEVPVSPAIPELSKVIASQPTNVLQHTRSKISNEPNEEGPQGTTTSSSAAGKRKEVTGGKQSPQPMKKPKQEMQTKVFLFEIQITLQIPVAHRRSINGFFHTQKGGLCDYQRYQIGWDNNPLFKHIFTWLIEKGVNKAIPDFNPPGNVDVEQRVISE